MQEIISKNNGYAIIATDEGARVLAAMNQKQKKDKGELNLLSKLWSS